MESFSISVSWLSFLLTAAGESFGTSSQGGEMASETTRYALKRWLATLRITRRINDLIARRLQKQNIEMNKYRLLLIYASNKRDRNQKIPRN